MSMKPLKTLKPNLAVNKEIIMPSRFTDIVIVISLAYLVGFALYAYILA